MSKDPALFTSFIDAASYFIYGKKPTTNMFILLELSGAIIAWDATNVKHSWKADTEAEAIFRACEWILGEQNDLPNM